MRKMLLLTLLFIIGLGLVGYGVYLLTYKHPADYTRNRVTVNGHVFNVDLADTASKRAQGLSGRERLAENEGMLFIFDAPDRYSFWMKDMRFALDIIWIRGDEIVDITKNAPPPAPGSSWFSLPQYLPAAPADKVLEINAGLADKFGIKTGDAITVILPARRSLGEGGSGAKDL